MPELYLDCSGGLSGDMFLAALADLGLDLSPLAAIFAAPGPDGSVLASRIEARDVRRGGFQGKTLDLDIPAGQPLRHLSSIKASLDALDISATAREQSRDAFRRLAEVEAKAHGIGLDKVHFHEIGAADTLVDVVGAFWGLERLGVTRVSSGPLPWFQGFVDCEHGRLPLPAPATLALYEGKPVTPSDANYELVTPTGALLADRLVQSFTPGPEGRLLKTGLGFGGRDTGQGLRAYVFEPKAPAASAPGAGPDGRLEHVYVLESNIDHLTGEELGRAFDDLFAAGALDVLYLPGVMKKGRPAGALQAMCRPETLLAVQAAFFASTLTLGVRRRLVERVVLDRRKTTLATRLGPLEAKVRTLGTEEYALPEHEALSRLAAKTGRSVAALRALLCAGSAEDGEG